MFIDCTDIIIWFLAKMKHSTIQLNDFKVWIKVLNRDKMTNDMYLNNKNYLEKVVSSFDIRKVMSQIIYHCPTYD